MSSKADYTGSRVVVMGLGLNGGGLESARFLASRGADVTVTDLRDETVLAPSIAKLEGLKLRYVLGHHDMEDFKRADIVVKNPAVRPDSPYLQVAKRVETDLSIFLTHCPSRLLAVTGSKGKSSTSSALHWGLKQAGRRAFIGGNITVSALSFLDDLTEDDDVVLELSSWQLGDLKGRLAPDGRALLKPRVAVITAILPDHLDRYGTMDSYVADKRIIYQGQDSHDATVCACDEWGLSFAAETRGRPLFYAKGSLAEGLDGGYLTEDGRGLARRGGELVELVPTVLLTPGEHQRQNLLAAALALLDLGLEPKMISEAMGSFPGIEHRLEFFHEANGVRYYNDTAATIPEAAAAAISAFGKAPILVTGGTDKALDFTPLAAAVKGAKEIILLAGTGSDKLVGILREKGINFRGPFTELDEAVRAAIESAECGDIVVLSPGCASFGMFLNEFDRGRKWKEAVIRLTSQV